MGPAFVACRAVEGSRHDEWPGSGGDRHGPSVSVVPLSGGDNAAGLTVPSLHCAVRAPAHYDGLVPFPRGYRSNVVRMT